MFFKRVREYFKFLVSLSKTNWRLLRGMWKLTRLPQPAITIFGGSRLSIDAPEAQQAKELAKILAYEGFSIITGGGPGIMEAANAGALDYIRECFGDGNKKCPKSPISGGIGLIKLNKNKANPYVQDYVEMRHFFARKWLLVRYSIGFVAFPGGFGTMDEIFEVLTLVQCKRMVQVPIILIGIQYWQPMVDWVYKSALAKKLIDPGQEKLFIVTDNIQEAAKIIVASCKNCDQSRLHNGTSLMN